MLTLGCAACVLTGAEGLQPASPHQGRLVIRGAMIAGADQTTDIEITDGFVSSVGSVILPDEEAVIVDAAGRWIVPAFIDSHVHLSYYPAAEALADGGIAGAVDHAAPVSFFDTSWAPLQVRGSGPMVTAVGGYPTQSWGAGGYGLEVADPQAATDAVVQLHGLGAGLIKLPVTGGNQLESEALAAAVVQAHALDLKVSTHALSDAHASDGGDAGCDVLAHTPTSALTTPAIAAWSDRAVISSLRAFGGGGTAVANLRALHDAGATVLYGTDFGNNRTTGIDSRELELMLDAGLSPAELIASATSVPAEYWGMEDLGALEPGKRASFLVLDVDPLLNPLALASPAEVWIDGLRR